METGNTIREKMHDYEAWLQCEEKSCGTIEKYLRDVRAFSSWLGNRELSKQMAMEWKEYLVSEKYAPSTINSMLASLNSFCAFADLKIRIRYLKIQRNLFREESKELTPSEYKLLVETAGKNGNERLALLMETICASGIRVSEVKYITVEAAKNGSATISSKGKVRNIFLPGKLCRKLLKYAKKQKNTSGEIFLTGRGTSLSRRQIWAEMKRLCRLCGVKESKVFPHNLRHLFAETFYRTYKDVVRLADVLGHSSIDTTRIYLITSGNEHRRQLEKLKLVT